MESPSPIDHAAALADLMADHWNAAGRPSYRWLARNAGVGHSTAHTFLTGRRPQPPSWAIVSAIAGALGVTGPDLIALQQMHQRAVDHYWPRRVVPPARPRTRDSRERLACPACGTELEIRARALAT